MYEEAAEAYAAALERLGRAYEADADRRRDLLQDIHLALWRSFERFDRRCSLRTWVYRVAHNVAASYVVRQRRTYGGLVGLEEIERLPVEREGAAAVERGAELEQLLRMVRRLKPADRQIMLLYLEGMDAASIGDVTGISPANVAMKIHRAKEVLVRRFQKGGRHVG